MGTAAGSEQHPAWGAEIGVMPGHLTLFYLVKDGLLKVCFARKIPPLPGTSCVLLLMPKEYWAQQGGNGSTSSANTFGRIPGNHLLTALLLHQNAVGVDILKYAKPPLKR